jgi:hypothetical protein
MIITFIAKMAFVVCYFLYMNVLLLILHSDYDSNSFQLSEKSIR